MLRDVDQTWVFNKKKKTFLINFTDKKKQRYMRKRYLSKGQWAMARQGLQVGGQQLPPESLTI